MAQWLTVLLPFRRFKFSSQNLCWLAHSHLYSSRRESMTSSGFHGHQCTYGTRIHIHTDSQIHTDTDRQTHTHDIHDINFFLKEEHGKWLSW